MIRFIHTADIHFGVENYGVIDAQSGIHTRLLDFQKVLDSCIDYAINNAVDFFLFCGDAYKTSNPTPTQQRLLMRCFLRLHAAGIPLIIIVGNHDNPLSFGKATSLDIFEQIPLDGFYVIDKPQVLALKTKSGPVNIVGMPWPSRQIISFNASHAQRSGQEITDYLSEGVVQLIKHYAQTIDPSIPAVFAGHLTVSSGIFSGSEKRAIYGNDPYVLPSDLALPIFDYVALGHLHRYQNLNPNGQPAVVYSGSLERIDFGEHKEDKGFCDVIIQHKGSTQHTFIKTSTRPFIQITIKLKQHLDQTKQIIERIAEYDLKESILKIIYHVPEGHEDTVDLNAVSKACSTAFYLASIVPIIIPHVRQKRTVVQQGMDAQQALCAYFSNESKERSDQLIKKALQLIEESNKENQHS